MEVTLIAVVINKKVTAVVVIISRISIESVRNWKEVLTDPDGTIYP